jgi:ornithine carbamoyltransferase
VRHTARILGRLYDAVECQGMAPELVRRVSREAAIPIYGGIACATHPTAALANQLDPQSLPADNRRFVLQALLLGSVG